MTISAIFLEKNNNNYFKRKWKKKMRRPYKIFKQSEGLVKPIVHSQKFMIVEIPVNTDRDDHTDRPNHTNRQNRSDDLQGFP